MFSYSVKVRKINNSKLCAFATVVIEDLLEIDGFKVINGSNGLFVSVPSHKGTVVEDGVKVDKYFDDVRFPTEAGQAFSEELKAAILSAYNNTSDPLSPSPSSSQSNAVKAKTSKPLSKPPSDNTPERTRKPLWGF